MRQNLLLALAWLLSGLLLHQRPAAGQTNLSACATGQDSVAVQLDHITNVVTTFPAQISSSYSLPYQPAGGVTVINDDSVCTQALTAYNGSPTPDDVTRVVVLKVGADRYVVTSPVLGSGRILYVIYDTSFVELAEIVQ